MKPEPREQTYSPEFFCGVSNSTQQSSSLVAAMVMSIFHPKSVVDIGCAAGQWLKAFAECGVQDYKGYDGCWVPSDHLLVPASHFEVVDLSRTMPRVSGFDLAVCLEVAEHLPPQMSSALIECLTSSAPAVLFSAAIPGQGGNGHINTRWSWFWDKLFLDQGFRQVDVLRPTIAYDNRIMWYYRQNLLCYVSAKRLSSFPALSSFASASPDEWKLIPISERILRSNVENFEPHKAKDLLKALMRKAALRFKKTVRR